MLTEKINFDHNTGDIATAFGISSQRASEITGSIIFTEIDKAFTAQSLYEDLSEAPSEFTSKTAVLSSVFDELTSNEEVIFATYEWSKHIVLKRTEQSYDKMLNMFTMMYMLSNQDKKKFIKTFVEKIESAREAHEGDE